MCLCLAQLWILAQFLGNLFSGYLKHITLSKLAGVEQEVPNWKRQMSSVAQLDKSFIISIVDQSVKLIKL